MKKELLSLVLEVDIDKIKSTHIENQTLYYNNYEEGTYKDPTFMEKINIHEFGMRCKEYSRTLGFEILSGGCEAHIIHENVMFHSDFAENVVRAETELDAIIEATQWVIDNKDNHE